MHGISRPSPHASGKYPTVMRLKLVHTHPHELWCYYAVPQILALHIRFGGVRAGRRAAEGAADFSHLLA